MLRLPSRPVIRGSDNLNDPIASSIAVLGAGSNLTVTLDMLALRAPSNVPVHVEVALIDVHVIRNGMS